MPHYVYILYSEKLDKYYIGSSHNPEQRLHYHNLGKKGWTKIGIPWKLVFKKGFPNKEIAVQKETFVKRQKSKRHIEKLVNGEYEL
ncbi:unnamed protein product [marine sediment metagenome]|uniref:GIY-YIG domain-containing protein n=1 Tax=marine sediment metagenome TaxID=412755 RepID=X0SFD8_9ZZZZ